MKISLRVGLVGAGVVLAFLIAIFFVFCSQFDMGEMSGSAGARLTKLEASKRLEEFILSREKMRLRLPYLFEEEGGYVFGMPHNNPSGDFILRQDCYRVDFSTGVVERLKGGNVINIKKYKFIIE